MKVETSFSIPAGESPILSRLAARWKRVLRGGSIGAIRAAKPRERANRSLER